MLLDTIGILCTKFQIPSPIDTLKEKQCISGFKLCNCDVKTTENRPIKSITIFTNVNVNVNVKMWTL